MDKYKQFYEEIKKLVREKGKSNFIYKEEIEELILEYEENDR